MFVVYKLTSPRGKSYIGQTCRELSQRLFEHESQARKGVKRKLYSALRKYPLNQWYKEVL